MPRLWVTMDDKLLRQVDDAAKRAGLSRSAYIARLVARDLEKGPGPGADPDVHKALAEIDRLFRENPPPPGFDWTAEIRKMRGPVGPPAWIGSGEGPRDLGLNAEKYIRASVRKRRGSR